MSTEATSAKTSETPCWSCGAPANGAHFCAACGKIQPLSGDADYFAFFGLPRRLTIDPEDLERRFHQLSWKLHPDNFVRDGERERELALVRSSQLNDAFRALRDPISRVEYLLASAGMRREGQHKQQAPPELLEEVFELNESLDELRGARQRRTSAAALADVPAETAAVRRKLEAASQNFAEKLAGVDAELEKLFGEWDKANADAGTRANPRAGPGAGPGARLTEARAATLGRDATNDAASDAARRKLMERMNEVLNRRSYIRNLVASVQKELEGE
jgi:molecular chaperone HscB